MMSAKFSRHSFARSLFAGSFLTTLFGGARGVLAQALGGSKLGSQPLGHDSSGKLSGSDGKLSGDQRVLGHGTAKPAPVQLMQSNEKGQFDDEFVGKDRGGVPSKREVAFDPTAPAGQIYVDYKNQYVYFTLGNGQAIQYVAVMGQGKNHVRGQNHRISRTHLNVTVDPQGNTIKPSKNAFLGVRILDLTNDDTQVSNGFSIHGTSLPHLLKKEDRTRSDSRGCIRLHNEDIIDLYSRVGYGTKVKVFYDDYLTPYVQKGRKVSDLTRRWFLSGPRNSLT